jgi:hypothetical protein
MWWLLAAKHLRGLSDGPGPKKGAALAAQPPVQVASRGPALVDPNPEQLLLGRTPPLLWRIDFSEDENPGF